MAVPYRMATTARALLPLAAAMTLAACGDNETAYEPAVGDVSGGDLIVTDPTPEAPPVELPQTPMTPVPPDAEPAQPPAPEPAPAL